MSSDVLMAEDKWVEQKSGHFVFYYKNAPKDFAKTVEQMAESYYDEIARNLDAHRFNPGANLERCKIYIYDDGEDYVEKGKLMQWSHGVASVRTRTIHTFPMAHGFFDSTLPHELGHIIFRDVIGQEIDVPQWFEEGVAMQQEKAKRFGADEAVQGAMKSGTFFSLGKLSDVQLTTKTDPDVVNLFYAESASVIRFMLNEYGQQRFNMLCQKLKEGMAFESALYNSYYRFKTIDDLSKVWENYLKQ